MVDNFYARLDKIQAEVAFYHGKNLYSKLTKVLEEGIHFIETKQDTIFRLEQVTDDHMVSQIYYSLVLVYYYSYNFETIPQVVDSFLSIAKTNRLVNNEFSYSISFHAQLALLRLGETTVDECLSILNDWKSKVIAEIDHRFDGIKQAMEPAIIALMLMKEFGKAIAIGKQLEQLSGDKLTLARIYIEQYRLGLSDHSVLYNFMPCPLDEGNYPRLDGFTMNGRFCQDLLVFAQWEVMYHKQASSGAVMWVDRFVNAICGDYKCRTCTQAITDSDVPFVCSGCRVACYCSLDHQRLNWKKDPLTGMRIGHKLLCPMMKTYRKWKHANHDGNEEVAKTWRRRYLKEIVYFLFHGLGLEERCFHKEM